MSGRSRRILAVFVRLRQLRKNVNNTPLSSYRLAILNGFTIMRGEL